MRKFLSFIVCGVVALAALGAYAQSLGDQLVGKGESHVGALLKPSQPALACIQVNSVGFYSCTDAGGYESTCAKATCPSGYTLTGGGGACAAGDRRVKSLMPRVDLSAFYIMCEEQGTDPTASAVCCKLN